MSALLWISECGHEQDAKMVSYLVGSAVSQEVDGLGLGVAQSMPEGRHGVGGATATQALNPLPRQVQVLLVHLNHSWLPANSLAVKRHQIELLLVP